MKRLIVPLLVIVMLGGAEMAARKIAPRVPAPLTWDTQFSQDKAAQLEDLGEQLQVVFTGSSVSQANFDPQLFVDLSPQFDTAYNTGLPSMTPRVWRQFLLDVVYPDYCPELLVIGVDIRQFNDNKPGSDDQLYRYLDSAGRLDAIGGDDVWRSAENWLEDTFALFRIRDRLREPDEVAARVWHIGDPGEWRNTNLTPLGRYTSNDDRTYEASDERLANLQDGAFLDLAFGGKETDALQGMIDDARQRGTLVVLVEMPTMRDRLAQALPNGESDFMRFTEVLAEVAADNEIPFYRFPEMDNQAIYYSDEYHMNWTGIETITTELAHRVRDEGLATGEVCAGETG